MVASLRELVERAEKAPVLRGVLDNGDWYLVGSRATGLCDELSDWDTVLCCWWPIRRSRPTPIEP
jgi:predicted nucleotidyltransferase